MQLPLRHLVAVCSLAVCSFTGAFAAHAAAPEASHDPRIDVTPCLAAIAARDDDKIIAVCGELIDSDKTVAADRLKALGARALAYTHKDQVDLAIADYDAALKIELARPDFLNARGELWRKKGNRPRAIRDFGAAMKFDPGNEVVRANYKALAQEIERMGVQMSVQPPPKTPLK